MIRYALTCDHDHGFETWFASSADYDAQVERGLVECPVCGSVQVRKQIMAPAVSGVRKAAAPDMAKMQTLMMQAAREVRAHVEQISITSATPSPVRRATSMRAAPKSAKSTARPRPPRSRS